MRSRRERSLVRKKACRIRGRAKVSLWFEADKGTENRAMEFRSCEKRGMKCGDREFEENERIPGEQATMSDFTTGIVNSARETLDQKDGALRAATKYGTVIGEDAACKSERRERKRESSVGASRTLKNTNDKHKKGKTRRKGSPDR